MENDRTSRNGRDDIDVATGARRIKDHGHSVRKPQLSGLAVLHHIVEIPALTHRHDRLSVEEHAFAVIKTQDSVPVGRPHRDAPTSVKQYFPVSPEAQSASGKTPSEGQHRLAVVKQALHRLLAVKAEKKLAVAQDKRPATGSQNRKQPPCDDTALVGNEAVGRHGEHLLPVAVKRDFRARAVERVADVVVAGRVLENGQIRRRSLRLRLDVDYPDRGVDGGARPPFEAEVAEGLAPSGKQKKRQDRRGDESFSFHTPLRFFREYINEKTRRKQFTGGGSRDFFVFYRL